MPRIDAAARLEHLELLAHLEPRALLSGTFGGVDVDGDEYTINLSGPGDLAVTTSAGGVNGSISLLALTNTTLASKVSISVKKVGAGDGAVQLEDLTSPAPLGAFTAPATDLVDASQVVFGVVGKLVLRDLRDDADVKIGGASTDKVDIVVRDTGVGIGDAGIEVFCRVKSFVGRVLDSSATFHEGVDAFKATGASNIFILVDAGPASGAGFSIGSLTLSSAPLAMALQTVGDIGAITAPALPNPSDSVFAQGRIGSVTVKSGDLSGLWVARSIGAINCKFDFSGEWSLTDADASGNVLGSLKADSVSNPEIVLDINDTVGRIGSIAVRTWDLGLLRAGSIGSISVKENLDVTLSAVDTTATTSIGKVKVGGSLSGTWEIRQDVTSVTAARTAPSGWRLTGPSNTTATEADIGPMKFTDKAANSQLSVRARTLASLAIAGDASFVGRFSGADALGQSIASISARNVVFDLGSSNAGGIGKITIGGANGGGISTEWVKSFKVTTINGSSGNLENFNIQIRSAAPGSTLFLASLDVKNGLINSNIKSNGPIGSVAVGFMDHAEIDSGTVTQIGFLPPTVGSLSAGGSIGSVLIRRSFSTDPALVAYAASNILARTIGKVTINGAINLNNTGVPFGFGAQTFSGKVQIRSQQGAVQTVVIPPTAGDVDPQSGDFRFRVFA